MSGISVLLLRSTTAFASDNEVLPANNGANGLGNVLTAYRGTFGSCYSEPPIAKIKK